MKLIFTAGYSELDDGTTQEKGHRGDVLIQDDEEICYEINFIDLARLEIDLAQNIEDGLNYFTDVGLIVIDVVTKESIVKAVKGLIKKKFWTTLKPLRLTPQPLWYIIQL